MIMRNLAKIGALLIVLIVSGISNELLTSCDSRRYSNGYSKNNPEVLSPALCLVYGQFSQTGDRIVDELAELKRLNIPADISVNLKYSPEIMAVLNDWSDRGNLVSPSFYPFDLDPTCPDANWHTYDEATCERLLIKAQKKVADAGFKRFDALDTYTPGNGLVRAAKKLGIHYLTGFCGPELANDTHWKFNQTGAPLIPYFASTEDFRKPELPSSDKWFQISNMELRNPLTCLEHWNESPNCPLNLIMGDRTIEPGDEPIETMATVTDWLEMSKYTNVPRLMIVNLQYFTSKKCFDLNRHFLIWLAEQRDLGRVRFVGMQEIAKLNKKAGGIMPQTTWYRGETMGQMCGGQAGDGNPCIINESMKGQWVWRTGQSGPERAYLYNKKWDYVPFDASGNTPESFGYTARVETPKNITKTETEVGLSWDASTTGPVFLCAWDAFDGLKAPFKLKSTEGLVSAEVVPHPSGQGGALIFRAENPKGSGKIIVEHSGTSTESFSQRWEELVALETTTIRGRSLTRFAPLVPCRFSFPIGLKVKRAARWEAIVDGHSSNGTIYPGESVDVVLDGTRSASMFRIWDAAISDLVVPKEILQNERLRLTKEAKAIAADMAPNCPAPIAPPMLGALAAIPEWAKVAAKNGADKEIAKIEQARSKYAPGKSIATMHMAIDLPYGSRGRLRSKLYNRQDSISKVEFFEYYYDYGQSYAPGVAGWNQFWQVSLGIRNHEKGKPYRLVLHTLDPEARGASVRIIASPASYDALVSKGAAVNMLGYQYLAQGLEHRFDANAFITVDIPASLTKEESIVVHIRSNSEQVKYDRLTEGFGFVFLSHAWLIER